MASNKLINDPQNVVVEMLEGMVAVIPHLRLLDGLPDIKVVYDADHDPSKVALISGGGSGHEPAHAGYVGQGMLTAAVCGDVFASPSSQAVLATIRAVCGSAGCLLIVKRYTGDMLQFGLAAEQAKAEGFRVEMVVVGDDCALPSDSIAGRRGLAGTVFVHKVAGAMAHQGKSLEDVAIVAGKAAQNIGTMGVALSACTLPGTPRSTRLQPGEIELGLGIHGEPGAEKIPYQSANEVVHRMLQHIVESESAYLPIEEGQVVALMVNNLGSMSKMELHIVARAAIKYLTTEAKVKVIRVFVGSFMTSLDMLGVSLTVFRVNNELLLLLDGPTVAPGWGSGAPACIPSKTKKPVPPVPETWDPATVRPAELSKQGRMLEAAIASVCDMLIAKEAELTTWDTQVGDGDCGLTLKKGAEAIRDDMSKAYSLNDPQLTAKQLAGSIRRAMGGSSGALYNIFLMAASNALPPGTAVVSRTQWLDAFAAGVKAIQTCGGAQKGHRTMLDALLPALESAETMKSAPVGAVWKVVCDAAREGAELTKSLNALAGRSSYVPVEALKCAPDPGAMAVSFWLNAIHDAVRRF